MPGTTTELSLSTAVDSDDNADYLTISLANSLRTLDGLFNNVTGHTHNGAHQGGPITPAAGSIQGSAIADGTITNAKLGQDVERNNLLTNGGMEFWQRGNGPYSTNGVVTADRWTLAGTTLSVSPNTANADGAGNCMAVTSTGAGGLIYQYFQGLNEWLSGKGRTFSISARVWCNTPNAVHVGLWDGADHYGAYHTGNSTYQTLTWTQTWPAGSTQMQARFGFDAACTAYIDNVCVVAGSVPASYVPLHPADEFARCQRYYEVLGTTDTTMMVGGVATAAGQIAFQTLILATVKVATPTVTFSAGFNSNNANAASCPKSGADGFYIQCTSSAAGQFYSYNLGAQKILVEANP